MISSMSGRLGVDMVTFVSGADLSARHWTQPCFGAYQPLSHVTFGSENLTLKIRAFRVFVRHDTAYPDEEEEDDEDDEEEDDDDDTDEDENSIHWDRDDVSTSCSHSRIGTLRSSLTHVVRLLVNRAMN